MGLLLVRNGCKRRWGALAAGGIPRCIYVRSGKGVVGKV